MRCAGCDIEIQGRFEQAQFKSLSGEDLRFLEQYLLAEFSIKALAEKSGMGYTAIRSRLDRIIATYRSHWNREKEKLAILERVEQGEITAGEAAEAIGKLK